MLPDPPLLPKKSMVLGPPLSGLHVAAQLEEGGNAQGVEGTLHSVTITGLTHHTCLCAPHHKPSLVLISCSLFVHDCDPDRRA